VHHAAAADGCALCAQARLHYFRHQGAPASQSAFHPAGDLSVLGLQLSCAGSITATQSYKSPSKGLWDVSTVVT
jgi:hypothetical protein